MTTATALTVDEAIEVLLRNAPPLTPAQLDVIVTRLAPVSQVKKAVTR